MLDKNIFKNCPSQYRSAPFWAWNDKLDKEVLLHQIHEMHKQGIGGFFMHPRGGLMDEYMGPHFMSMVKACVDEAERLGMKAWLYDEDRFPSGNAAGRVAASNADFRQKALEMVQMDCANVDKDSNILRIYVAEENSPGGYRDVTTWLMDDIKALNTPVLVFRVIYMPPQLLWNNNSYADLTCKDAVNEFIRETHERYKRELQPRFGNVVPGIFTDEPDFNVSMRGRKLLPWALDLEREFYERKGYALTDHLIKLFIDIEDYKRVRFDYWDVLSDMFIDAFVKNIYDWCEHNGLKFTGHYWEHEFPLPVHNASVMPNYEFMQYPGIDMLFNTEEERDQVGNDFIVKEVSSVAHQLNKERVLSETHGASGWDLSFAEQKRVIDWQFALGVNLVCQHLVMYSMKGYRKRDFPLSFMDHQPWWDCYKLLGDYIGRMSYALTQGDFVGDVLVLHPSSSTWAEFHIDGDNQRLDAIGCSAKNLVKTLNRIHCFFDLGDDKIISRHGHVQDGRFVVGNMAYSTVILPEMTVMRCKVFELLKKFARQGGHIVATGMTPMLLDGIENKELESFFNSDAVIRCQPHEAALTELLTSLGNEIVKLKELNGKTTDDLYVHKRRCGDQEMIFICNFSRTQRYDIQLELGGMYHVEEWDAVTGNVKTLQPVMVDGAAVLALSFYPAGARLLVIDSSRKAENVAIPARQLVNSITLDNWNVNRVGYNALAIERCSVALGDGEWEPECNVLAMDDKLKDRLGMERGNIFVRQPWMYSQQDVTNTVSLKVRYTFYVAEKLEGNILLAAEQTDVFAVSVNGHLVKPDGGTFIDRAFATYDIKEYVNVGLNEVMLFTDQYGVLTTIESIYIIGDFKLKKGQHDWELHKDGGIKPGDWTQQGYPYYSGKVEYTCKVAINDVESASVKLYLEQWYGVVAKIIVNGRQAAIFGWEPYEADISGLVKNGNNEITVEVMNSLQNLLGPHQYQQTDGIVTPGSFYDESDVKFAASGFSGRAVIKIYK